MHFKAFYIFTTGVITVFLSLVLNFKACWLNFCVLVVKEGEFNQTCFLFFLPVHTPINGLALRSRLFPAHTLTRQK